MTRLVTTPGRSGAPLPAPPACAPASASRLRLDLALALVRLSVDRACDAMSNSAPATSADWADLVERLAVIGERLRLLGADAAGLDRVADPELRLTTLLLAAVWELERIPSLDEVATSVAAVRRDLCAVVDELCGVSVPV